MDVRARLKDFCKTNKISQRQVADSIGYSATYLSKYMNDDKNFNYHEEVELKVKQFLDSFKPKKSQHSDDFIITHDVKAIFGTIDMIVSVCGMGAIIGLAGTGKTNTIKEYAKKHPQTLLIEVVPTIKTKALLKRLCLNLDVRSAGSSDDMFLAITDELKKRNHIIIVDEAETLNHTCLEILRRMHDLTKTPLVFAGTHKLENNLTGILKNNTNEFEQLSSRASLHWRLQGLKPSEIKDICSRFGIDDSECVDDIERLARRNFRSTMSLLKRTKELSEKANSKITRELIAEAKKMLMWG